MQTLWQDLRYGMRMLLKKPGFTVVALITLSLGIGANTAIFSFVNGVLLRPLPYDQPERLVRIYEKRVKQNRMRNEISAPDFLDWQQQNTVFEAMAALGGWSANLTGSGEPEQLVVGEVSATMFPLLRVNAQLGRSFLPEEDKPGAARVVILSHKLWQNRFGGNAEIVGQSLTLNGNNHTVVGVMPPGFQTLYPDFQLWRPIKLDPANPGNRGSHGLYAIARLKPNVAIARAQAEMDAITARLEQQYPEKNTGHHSNVFSLHDETVGEVRPALLALLVAVGLILLIACANVANLLLARSAARQKEMAIRTAMGASRFSLIRQLLTESLLLGLAGGVLGLLLGVWGRDLLINFSPPGTPRVAEVRMDAVVLGFTLLLSLLTTVLFGLLPAFQSSKANLNETLKEGGRTSAEGFGRNRARSLLVITEVALAITLMIGAGLMMKSFLRLRAVSPGFNGDQVLTMRLNLTSSKYREESQQAAFYQGLHQRIRAIPGIQSAAMVVGLPFSDTNASRNFGIEGRAAENPNEVRNARFNVCSPDYFSTLGIPIIKGRDFSDADVAGRTDVAIISETMARRFWPDEDPLGKRIRIGSDGRWSTIVGVVGDVRSLKLNAEPHPEMYYPMLQVPFFFTHLTLRATGDPKTLIAAVRNEVRALDQDLPIANVAMLDDLLGDSVAPQRLNSMLLGLFSALALLLAAVGIYGVMAYLVSQRAHELGIRIALGAGSRDIKKLIVGQGMTLALIGVGIGIAASLALTRLMKTLMQDLLFGVSATDRATFIFVALLLSAVAFVACWIPARRAAKVDPMVALRAE
ncbi:MAG: ABC transporter permease [Blastocatellia bacterium]